MHLTNATISKSKKNILLRKILNKSVLRMGRRDSSSGRVFALNGVESPGSVARETASHHGTKQPRQTPVTSCKHYELIAFQ
jgi:hypothetical protein